MARRSIILQELEQNDKKLGSYNQAIEAYNADAKTKNANNNAQVNEYNAFINSVKAGQQNAVGEYSPGAYTLLKGYSDSSGKAGITPYSADNNGNVQMAGKIYDKLPDQLEWGNGAYLKNADGTATYHTWNTGTDLLTGQTQENPGWQKSNYTARVMDSSSLTAPTAADTPKEPDFYTMSNREKTELANPTADAAAATLAATKSLPVKTELANQQSTGNSVYAGRDQNESIKQSGILARVMSGQLA